MYVCIYAFYISTEKSPRVCYQGYQDHAQVCSFNFFFPAPEYPGPDVLFILLNPKRLYPNPAPIFQTKIPVTGFSMPISRPETKRLDRFFSKSLVTRHEAPKAWILACEEREPHTPVGRVMILPSSTLHFHTRSRPFVQRPRAFVLQTNAKNTTVLQSTKRLFLFFRSKFVYGAVILKVYNPILARRRTAPDERLKEATNFPFISDWCLFAILSKGNKIILNNGQKQKKWRPTCWLNKLTAGVKITNIFRTRGDFWIRRFSDLLRINIYGFGRIVADLGTIEKEI